MNTLYNNWDHFYPPVSQPYPAVASPSFPCRSGSLIQADDCCSEGSLTEEVHVCCETEDNATEDILCKSCHQCHVTIDVLPDDVLLGIFDCYMDDIQPFDELDEWHTLVHVSRKWRCVVFDSPRRLNLELLCFSRRPVREMLTIWPPLPIIIREYDPEACDEDNVIAALEQHDRIREIDLYRVPGLLLERLLAEMQKPFPALTYLKLQTKDDTAPIIPHTFLGGFAPDLRRLSLEGILFPFPVLRKLLLSTTNLVTLSLSKILHSEYFSPDAMVACVSALARLECLEFGFKFRRSRPYRENRRPPPPTRALLPALRRLKFTGVSEYLEDLVARIDVPVLYSLNMTFFHQLVFDTPQLAQFIIRSDHGQKDNAGARVFFSRSDVLVYLPGIMGLELRLEVLCRQSDWRLSAAAQVCSSSFPQGFIPTVKNLHVLEGYIPVGSQPCWQDDIESSQWLELLHPFTGVERLFLSKELAQRIEPALQELIGERVNEVLPALQSIHLEGLQPSGVVPKVIEQFVTARQISSHPIAVIPWRRY